MIILVLAGLVFMIGVVAARVVSLLETMPTDISGNPADLVLLINLALAPSSNRASFCNIGGLAIVVGGWLFALIDAYRLGQKKQSSA